MKVSKMFPNFRCKNFPILTIMIMNCFKLFKNLDFSVDCFSKFELMVFVSRTSQTGGYLRKDLDQFVVFVIKQAIRH